MDPETTNPKSNRHVLYSHWGVGNKKRDIASWEEEGRDAAWLLTQPVCEYLIDVQNELVGLLEETRGLLVLFFDPGWKLALKPELTADEEAELELAKAYSEAVLNVLTGRFTIDGRLRLLSVRTLQEFIQGLRQRDRPRIFRWFVGDYGLATYDSPKIIEAFLRVQLLGSGVPLLRVDWDALVNVDAAGNVVGTGLSRGSIEKCLDHAERERMDVQTTTWVCSAGYRLPDESTYGDWSRGFATRIQPALFAKDEMCKLVCGWNFGLLQEEIDENIVVEDIGEIAEDCFDQKMAELYLGVEESEESDKGDWNTVFQGDCIATLGSDPLRAVISGALLNLSASAIIDLPPVSNMTRGVMWIDDHLKFELHRALGHLHEDASERCRIPAEVEKGRQAPRANLAAYTWASYLPTLLLGLVMDAWIRVGPDGQGPLTQSLGKAIRSGDFDHRDGLKLELALAESAIERLERVRSAWSKLIRGEMATLAAVWAGGDVEKMVKKQHPTAKFSERSRGLGMVASGTTEIKSFSDLRPEIEREIRELIWDAIDYIHLTLHWPGMIQTIRAVEKKLVA